MRVAIIGAGPSGLVTLRYLSTAHEFFPGMKPVDVKLFEAEDQIGGTFRYRTYENGEVRSRSCLARDGLSFPRFPLSMQTGS